MDKLLISKIEFHGHCGVTEEERRSGQRLSVNIEALIDLTGACGTDRLDLTANYADLSARIVAIGRHEKFSLVEALAGRIAEDLLEHFPRIEEVCIQVHKCRPPVEEIQGTFGVEIRRSRQSP